MMKKLVLLILANLPLLAISQNSPDSNTNIALLSDATITSNVSGGRGVPGEVLYDPSTNAYHIITQFNEHGVAFAQNLGLASRGNGMNWQVEWTSPKNINYITFGGTYSNQPQPNTSWAISYFDGTTWTTLDSGTGGWIDSGIYQWGGTTQTPILATRLLLELYSDGIHDLISPHIRARGGISTSVNDSATSTKACLIQYLPSNPGSDTQSPTAPSLANSGKTDTTIDLSWSGATDNVGVTGYKVFKDNALEATLGNVTNYQVTGLSASTTYQFKLRALDAAGNESVDSNSISITTDAGSGNGNNGGGGSVWSENNAVASYSGEVAIGRSTVPSGYQMAVEGKIRTREVRVDQENWPDYVFEEDYDLPTLKEIQRYINENGHLPNMPSAKEVELQGMELGKMDRLLLEKVEELTLYVIELKKQIKKQRKEIEILSKNK